MRLFVYKTLFVFFCLFLLFNLTIGYQIRKIENSIQNLSSKEKIESVKEKIRKEMKNGIDKDNISLKVTCPTPPFAMRCN